MKQPDMSPAGLGLTADDLGIGLGRKALAEFLGTMMFIFLGCGSVVGLNIALGVDGGQGTAAKFVGVALAHGLAIAVMVAATARISGGHINPAVTVAMIVTSRIKLGPGLVYIVAQCAGAVLGAFILDLVITDVVAGNLGTPTLDPLALDSTGAGVIVEAMLTFVLVFTVFACAVDKRGLGNAAPIAIGLAVLIGHFIGIPLTGSAINPAREFGPAVVSGTWDDWWVYWIGPILGALIAALVYAFIYLERPDEEEAAAAA